MTFPLRFSFFSTEAKFEQLSRAIGGEMIVSVSPCFFKRKLLSGKNCNLAFYFRITIHKCLHLAIKRACVDVKCVFSSKSIPHAMRN
jgi:hypothetical protein